MSIPDGYRTMRFASSISDSADVTEAVSQLLSPIDQRLTPGMVDLVFFFSTAHFEDELPEILERVGDMFPSAVLVGCTAEGTIGEDRELERTPSMSLLAAIMPDVQIHPFHAQQNEVEKARTTADWERIVAVSPESNPAFIVFADPFRLDVQRFVDQINDTFPGAPLVGGVASAGQVSQQNRLILNGAIHREGIVGVSLAGRIKVDTVVSQGCGPIGTPFVITKGHRNVVQELGGRPAIERLHDVLVELEEDDEKMAREALFLGRVIHEYQDRFSRGDFLIHNIIGVDRKSGAIAIAGPAKVGTTVQFHIRDAANADEDLRRVLEQKAGRETAGAMLFGCTGRGLRMWSKPGHDVGVLREVLGNLPVAGFFCGGEFGPVGGRNFVHGFTASIALFQEPQDSES